ncbi:MATE family efflux transporter (plasmid) [Sinorhizobium meliloti]|uniref:MATE family efflux transporter n=1 Tax=Rhizobium meliloti TaxID=382 RepID=UPI001F15A59F|nr:MATE family efflux transporter [Sinorhizobium meliloti]MCO6424525.1 MATE family efflux transporter [Sinorhizobium meliloti]WRQ71945.1 MATE family efflux transporter [Sinorhizobium meliloti]
MEQKTQLFDSRPFRVTNRQVLAIAIPMALAYLTTPLLGLVDTAVVGRFGDVALLGGLATGAVVFDVVFTPFNFLRSGTTGLVAQAFGRGDILEEKAAFWRAFSMAAISGMVIVLLSPLIAVIGRWFMHADQPVAAAMDIYIRIRLISTPATLINYAILGYFLGRGKAVLGLLLQLLVNGTNIAFSIVLGIYLGWGIAGVAWGTVCSEVIAMVAGMAVLVGRFRNVPKLSLQHTFNMTAMRRMLQLNGDIMIRSLALTGAYILFTRQGAQLGALTLAANAVLMHVFFAGAYFLDGFAAAAEQLAGRAVGALNRPAFSGAVKLTAAWALALSGFTSIVVFLFGEQLIEAMTKAADVRAEAVLYLPWAAFATMSGVLASQMNGVFIGAAWSRDMRNTMLMSFAAFVAALFSFGQMFGNHGLWSALHVFLLLRGISLLLVMPRRVRTTFEER